MSTKTTTQTNQQGTNAWANNYNPLSMDTYRSFLRSAGPYITGQINSPFSNPFYQFGLQQSMRGASQQGANNMGAMQQLMRTSGFGGSAGQGFQAAQMGRIGRANSGMMADAKISNVLGALTRQQQLATSAMGYQPLVVSGSGTQQMSGTTTQSTGGLGTWLPQVAGMGLAALTGGASLAAGAGMGALGGVGAGQLGFGGMGGMLGGASMNPLSSFGASSWGALPPSMGPNPYMLGSFGFGGQQ